MGKQKSIGEIALDAWIEAKWDIWECAAQAVIAEHERRKRANKMRVVCGDCGAVSYWPKRAKRKGSKK